MKRYLFMSADGVTSYGFFFAESDEQAKRICSFFNKNAKVFAEV